VIEQILAIAGKPASLMTTVTDRPGHDRRYALSSEKLSKETGWAPQMDFERGLKSTVDWYRAQEKWVRDVKSGEYQSYYAKNYGNRTSELKQVNS
jgi:dTDP-glucose 4,6-dehydratase